MIVAGYSSAGQTNAVGFVNLETYPSTCQPLPAYPLTVDGLSGIFFDGSPLVCGGQTNSPSLIYNDICFKLKYGSWVSDFRLLKGISHFGGMAMFQLASGDKYPLIAGGWDGSSQTTTQIYNSSTGWKQFPKSLPYGVFGHCTCMINSTTAMVSGGTNSATTFNTVYFLTDNGRGWIVGPPLMLVRQRHGCNMIASDQNSDLVSAIVTGGFNTDLSVEILDPGSNSWRHGPNLPRSFSFVTLVSDLKGGVLLYNSDTKNIFRLRHAGLTGSWEILAQTTPQTIRWTNSIFLVSDQVGNCTF